MFFVQDDFFKDPDAVREIALKSKFDTKDNRFPGARTSLVSKFSEVNSFSKNFSRLIDGKTMKLVEGCFQFLGSGHRKSYVHIDPDVWAGIIFLSKQPSSYPGTSFYRHKATGIDHIVNDSKWLLNYFTRGIPEHVARDRFDLKKWKCVMTIPAQFNRLILFRSDFFHMNASRWGTNPGNGRLTYNFYLR